MSGCSDYDIIRYNSKARLINVDNATQCLRLRVDAVATRPIKVIERLALPRHVTFCFFLVFITDQALTTIIQRESITASYRRILRLAKQ